MGFREILDDATYEILPVGKIIEEMRSLKKKSRVAIANHDLDLTMDLAGRLSSAHMVIPHLRARDTHNKNHLESILAKIWTDYGIREIFVVGGDVDTPVGIYESAYQMLLDVHDISIGKGYDFRIGITGYPQGHSNKAIDEVIAEETIKKSRLADYIVTQMCLSSKNLIDYMRWLRREDVDIPVRVGVPSIYDQKKMLRLAEKIGLEKSLRFLRSNRYMAILTASDYIAKAAEAFPPLKHITHLIPLFSHDKLVSDLSLHSKDLGIEGYHLFTMNQLSLLEQRYKI